MPVQTRSETLKLKNNHQLSDTNEPVIMSADAPAAGKPPCYLARDRFLTNVHRICGGKTAEEVSSMMAMKQVANKVRTTKKEIGTVLSVVAEKKQVQTHDDCLHSPKETTHGLGWNGNVHYMSIGGQCGQSCPCCRAHVYNTGMDEDAKWGACSICLSN